MSAGRSSRPFLRLSHHHHHHAPHGGGGGGGRRRRIKTGWRRGVVVSGVRRMNEVNARRARLVPGWGTVFGPVYHLGV